ncbi:MAG: hypothetical protein D6689_02505 [Deltaproteobacteria bacterium]|nr:MAG: hypothetical protein D6689_02505 [Deltaproteobacteria bacterium]
MDAAARALMRSRRVKLWAAVHVAVAILCALTPLLDRLAYPSSFVMALVASVAGADLGAALVRRARATPARRLDHALAPGRAVAGVIARAAAVEGALLVPPAVLLLLNALRVRNCDLAFGLEAYAGLAVGSGLAGVAAGAVAAVAVGARRGAAAAPFAIVVASWAAALWRVYREPPVFAYGAFGGYFPGNLYDERIDLTAAFYWARAFHAAVAVAAAAAVAAVVDVPTLSARIASRSRRPAGPRRRPIATAAAAAAVAILLAARGGELGFRIDDDAIRAELGGRYETDHFVIYYPLGGDIERDIALIAEDHEFRYAQVVRAFGLRPGGAKIVSYYFRDADQKRRLFGAERVHMAKPWARQIFVDHRPFPHPVLRHEIAHVVAGSFGDPIFGVSARAVFGLPVRFNAGLIEGAAVAADWPGHRGDLTPDENVRAMQVLGVEPPVERLLGVGFFAFAPARSYTTAGSFLHYLLDRYGPARFRALYASGGDFAAAYGRTLGALAAEWRAYLRTIELPDGVAEAARERFTRRSVFERPCPHAIARRRERMAQLAASGRRADAIALARRVCRDAPDEPRYRMELAELLLRDRRPAEAAAELRAIADDGAAPPTARVEALVALADLAGRDGRWDDVRRELAAAAALPADDDLRRQVAARREAVDHAGPAGPALRAYFWDHPHDRRFDAVVTVARAAAAAAAEPAAGLAHYLVGFQLFRHDAWADAAAALGRALDRPLHPLVRRKAAELLAVAAYRTGDDAAVERAAAILGAAGESASRRLAARDWLARIRWRRTGRLP